MAKSTTLWVLSNRQDDRVVLWERDPAHPGGEAFVGGPTPAYVGRTAEVERLLKDGMLVEVSEPKDGPRKPIVDAVPLEEPAPDMPGQPTRLGRTPDPAIFGGEAAADTGGKKSA